MRYQDRVYGEFEISEPVILALLATPQMKRLAGIDMHGNPFPYFEKYTFSRLEHSLGVALILRKYGASLEQQVAGLLHDVSHTAFSHAGDFLFGKGTTQSHGDDILKEYLISSGLQKIVEQHGLTLGQLVASPSHLLLEQPLPSLCADRIDYALRELVVAGDWTAHQALALLSGLKARQGRWIFETEPVARKFVEAFKRLNGTVWASPQAAVMFATLEKLLKYAINKEYLTEHDLWTTDYEVSNKLQKFASHDPQLNQLYSQAFSKQGFRECRSTETPDIAISVKSRAIDPWVGDNRYSDLHPEYGIELPSLLKPKRYELVFQSSG